MIRGATKRTDSQNMRLGWWLESLGLVEQDLAPDPRTRSIVSVHMSRAEHNRITLTSRFLGIGQSQLLRGFVLDGLRAQKERIEAAKELGYALS